MTSRYDRIQFQEIVTLPDGTQFINPLTGTYSFLTSRLTMGNAHQVTADEIGNLPLISYREYGFTDLWWLIGLVNGIVIPFTDLVAGASLQIPTIGSIDNYINEAKNVNSSTSVQLS